MNEITIFTDGGARGNPGPSAAAWVAYKDQELIAQGSEYLGIGTNNQAEYMGVICALKWLMENNQSAKVMFFLDSELVVNQLKGRYKIKAPELIKLSLKIRELVKIIGRETTFTSVRREKNKIADKLVNETLDKATT